VYSFETRDEKVFTRPPSENFLMNRPSIWFHDNAGFLERRWNDERRETISIHRFDLSGVSTKLLEGPAALLRSEMALSPDDKTLFVVGPDARGILNTVFAFDLTNGDHKPVVALGNRQTIETLQVNHSGTILALVVRSATGRMSIALVGVDGSDYRVRFTSNSDVKVAALSPSIGWTNNDQEILFMTETSLTQLSDARIMRLSVTGEDKPEWTRVDGDGLRNSDPLRRLLSLSDDGSRIVYSSRTPQVLELWSVDLSSMLKAQSVVSR
jgi:hypothetical protein